MTACLFLLHFTYNNYLPVKINIQMKSMWDLRIVNKVHPLPPPCSHTPSRAARRFCPCAARPNALGFGARGAPWPSVTPGRDLEGYFYLMS
jgi:hypothetical protein